MFLTQSEHPLRVLHMENPAGSLNRRTAQTEFVGLKFPQEENLPSGQQVQVRTGAAKTQGSGA